MCGSEPSAWVVRFAARTPPGRVLDLACGHGRHTTLFLGLGHPVTAVDRVMRLDPRPNLERLELDLETGAPLPLQGREFAGVVVTRYLYRPLLPDLVRAVAPGGWLVYETFARGQEMFGRPRRPEFLLEPGELLEVVRGNLRVIAYEDDVLPGPTAVQRVAARRD